MIHDRRTVTIWGALAATCFATQSCAAKPLRHVPRAFSRGINLHHLLNWPEMSPGRPPRFVWPPFQDPAHQISHAEIEQLRTFGFDFVRITLQPGIFMAETGQRLEFLHRRLVATTEAFLRAGLGVIIDPHPVDQHPKYMPTSLVAGPTSSMFRAYSLMLRGLAQKLDHLSGERVALELMNEPALSSFAERMRWPQMARRLYSAIRASSLSLTVVVPGPWATWRGLVELVPDVYDDRCMFTFHYYEPQVFTHERASNEPELRFARHIPWPTSPEGLQEARSASEVAIADASGLSPSQRNEAQRTLTKRLDEYAARPVGPREVGETFQRVAEWADRHSVARERILLGEFGAVRTTSDAIREAFRLAWLTTVRAAAESRGFGWALWLYSGAGGMAISDAAGLYDQSTLRALGLVIPGPR